MLLDRRQLSPWGHGTGSSLARCQQLLHPPALTATRPGGAGDRAQALLQEDMGQAARESKEPPQATTDGSRSPGLASDAPAASQSICEGAEPTALPGRPSSLRAGPGRASRGLNHAPQATPALGTEREPGMFAEETSQSSSRSAEFSWVLSSAWTLPVV